MKITKRDLLVVLYIVSVIALYLVYQFVYTPKLEEVDTLNAENSTLKTQADELEAKKDKQPQIESEISEMETEIESIVSDYPGVITEEDIILYVSELNREMGVNATGVTFTEPSTVYSVVGEESAVKYQMLLQEIQVTVDYTTDYEGFKKIVNYINADTEHREIASVGINVNTIDPEAEEALEGTTKPVDKETGEATDETESLQQITGNFTLVLYFIDGKLTDDPNNRYDNDDINHGVENVFG